MHADSYYSEVFMRCRTYNFLFSYDVRACCVGWSQDLGTHVDEKMAAFVSATTASPATGYNVSGQIEGIAC